MFLHSKTLRGERASEKKVSLASDTPSSNQLHFETYFASFFRGPALELHTSLGRFFLRLGDEGKEGGREGGKKEIEGERKQVITSVSSNIFRTLRR